MICRLPTESLYREQMFAEASQVGNKKEAVVQCAMEACRILDAEGVLREPLQQYKRKVRDWEENDYYDSDEDNFFDRTGDGIVISQHSLLNVYWL
jgi:protein phosphatase 1D